MSLHPYNARGIEQALNEELDTNLYGPIHSTPRHAPGLSPSIKPTRTSQSNMLSAWTKRNL
jgi:hypothetical protein